MRPAKLRTCPDTGMQEKFCRKCKDWWPATEEFFQRTPHGTLTSPCRACIWEKRQETNAELPCAFEGCAQPRYTTEAGSSSYCARHHSKLQAKYRRRHRAKQGVANGLHA